MRRENNFIKLSVLAIIQIASFSLFAQTSENTENRGVINSHTPTSETKSLDVEKENSTQRTVEPASEYPKYISISNTTNQRGGTQVNMTKEERIADLQKQIESIEGKLFTMSGEPDVNEEEIRIKEELLEQKRVELNKLLSSNE